MKRKKWSELEEKTLISKYQDLKKSGTLAKLKTREKKFKPIADHINSIHNNQDTTTFPFKWTWRDVSIKVQNMRHQYLGVKQKIRVSDRDFNWDDGVDHWDNFIIYKDVFGDVELDDYSVSKMVDVDLVELGFDEDGDGDGDGDVDGSGEGEGSGDERRGKRGRVAGLGARVIELGEVLVRREEKRREREFVREEEGGIENEKRVMEMEARVDERELELEERECRMARREFERRVRLEREIDEVREWRMKMEEKREEEEMEWRERMLSLQIQHEKQMLQLHAHACQNQMQIVGLLTRFLCQFFGSPGDGLGGGLATLSPQVLQNLQHPVPGDLRDNAKPGSNSPSDFI